MGAWYEDGEGATCLPPRTLVSRSVGVVTLPYRTRAAVPFRVAAHGECAALPAAYGAVDVQPRMTRGRDTMDGVRTQRYESVYICTPDFQRSRVINGV